ncbi:MAG TPA: hypothetical protein DEO99_01880, partial [Bacteroidetes bacterium]|nr:hypothetical protein [Bacteroidota bacterium]
LNGNTATVFIEDGSSASVDLTSLVNDADADPNNELQDLSINATNDSILISNGQGISLSSINTD